MRDETQKWRKNRKLTSKVALYFILTFNLVRQIFQLIISAKSANECRSSALDAVGPEVKKMYSQIAIRTN